MNNNHWHIAQMNIGRMTGVNISDPVMKDFVDQLETINALAEQSDGFVWRLKDEGNNATSFNLYNDNRIIVNFSVWKTIDHLRDFVYQSAHVEVMRDRKKWFEKFGRSYMVLWYTPAGYIPSLEEAVSKLELLQKLGPSTEAFDFRNIFESPVSLNTRA